MFVSSLSDKEENRLPVPLSDAPSDADYAVEIIAQRIAKGEDIKPPRKPRSRSAPASEVNLSSTVTLDTLSSSQLQSSTSDGVNWKKWGARVAQGKSLLDDGKQLLSRGTVGPLFIQNLNMLIVTCHGRLSAVSPCRRDHLV